MDGFIVTIGLGVAMLVLLAAGVAAWEHRKRMAEARRRLAQADRSRRELQMQVEAADAHQTLMSEAMQQARTRADGLGATPAAVAATVAAGTADRADAAAPPASAHAAFDGPGWAETQPMTRMNAEPPFAETMPAGLEFGDVHFADTLPAEFGTEPDRPAAPAPAGGKSRQPA